MATSRAHLVHMPKNFNVLRSFQLVFSLALLGLCIFDTLFSRFGTFLFMSVISFFSCVIFIWILSATTCAPRAYNYWAVLAFEILLFIFWLVSLSLSAIVATYYSVFLSAYVGCSRYNAAGQCINYVSTPSTYTIYAILFIVTAALAGLMFLFSAISMITVSVMIHRHRRAGGHCKLVKDTGAYSPNPVPVYVNPSQMEKANAQPQPQAYPVNGQHYGQQPGQYSGMASPAPNYQIPQ